MHFPPIALHRNYSTNTIIDQYLDERMNEYLQGYCRPIKKGKFLGIYNFVLESNVDRVALSNN